MTTKAVALLLLGLTVVASRILLAQTGASKHLTAELECKLDSRHAKVGDRVVLRAGATARASDGSVIPRGAKLLGRVTEVQRYDKSHADAQVAVLIDHAQWKGVHDRAMHIVVESIEPIPESPPGFAGNAPLVGGWGKSPSSPWSHASPAVSTTKASSEKTAAPAAKSSDGAIGPVGINQQMAAQIDISLEETFVGRATGILGVFVSSDSTHASSGMIFAKGKDLRLDYGVLFSLTVIGPETAR